MIQVYIAVSVLFFGWLGYLWEPIKTPDKIIKAILLILAAIGMFILGTM